MTTSWAPARSEYLGLSAETQRERVREILRSAGNDGICSLSFYSLGLPNGRTRVYELRDGDGLLIETRRCQHELYHRDEARVPSHVRFIWRWNGNPLQLGLRLK